MSSLLSAPVSPCAPASFVSLFSNPDFRESLKEAFDYSAATSDLKILKRLSVVETDLGRNDLADFEEEHVPTIPKQIKQLSERLEQPLNKPTESIKTDVDGSPQTITENRA